MPHQAETPSSAINPALTASTRRKRLILLCSEDLRPVACGLEDALRSRGWQVSVEFGADARPWIQKIPPVRPSVRVLCVPGTVDRTLAQQLRTAFRPDPDADLHILGVDDSPGLVYEIERIAGVKHPRRRSLHAQPRLRHTTQLESQARTDRSWRVGAVSALAAFAITLGGMRMLEHPTESTESSHATRLGLATGLTSLTRPSPSNPSPAPRLHDPVLSNVAPSAPLAPMEWTEPTAPEEDFEIVILDDQAPGSVPRRVRVLATPLAAPTPALPEDLAVIEVVDLASPLPTLPPGFLPVAGLPMFDGPTPVRQLPPGFLPVAGMTARPSLTTVDPFETAGISSPVPHTTVDPFAAPSDDTAAS